MKASPHSFPDFSLAPLLMLALVLLPISGAMAGSTFQPPKSGAPGNREAGAARSDTCASTAKSNGLTAVLPTSNLGLTTQAFPTFFAYIPPNNAQRAEFRLIDEDGDQEVFTGQVQLPRDNTPKASYKYKASVVGLSLPKRATMVGLMPGKRYLWALMLVCNTQNRAEDIVITGVVQRVGDDYLKGLDPEIKRKLNGINRSQPREKLAIYGAAGIWQDLLADVAMLMQKNSSTYNSTWKSLLSEQGLAAIATFPVVESQLEPLQP